MAQEKQDCERLPRNVRTMHRLVKLIDPGKDSLRFYYFGDNWKRRIEHIGAKETYDPEGVIIV